MTVVSITGFSGSELGPVQGFAFNAPGNNPYPDGSSSTGVDLGGLRSGASSPSSANPGSILLLNLNDLTNPNPAPNIFDPPEEEELLKEAVLRGEQAPAVATPDVTVAPISLRRADAPPVERIVIELEPRMHVDVEAPRAPKAALVGVLALPVLMSQLAEKLRPNWAKVRVALRKIWKS